MDIAFIVPCSDSSDLGTECIQPFVNPLVSTVYLFDIVDHALSLRTHGCNQQGYSCAYIRRGHLYAFEGLLARQSDDGGPVRVAEDDLCAHVNQLIHEEKAAFEHLLMYKNGACSLRGRHQDDAEEVGREAGPDLIGDGEYAAVYERVDFIKVLGGNMNVITSEFHLYSQSLESGGDDAQVLKSYIGDGQLALSHRGKPYE